MTGDEIKAFREAMGWSQRVFAEAIPATRRSVLRWEHDTVRPHPFVRQRIQDLMRAHGYGVRQAPAFAPIAGKG